MNYVVVSGVFDNIQPRDVRFLQESAKLGKLRVCLWSDKLVEKVTGQPPKFPFNERHYFLQAIRFVDEVVGVDSMGAVDAIPQKLITNVTHWAVDNKGVNQRRLDFCKSVGIELKVVREKKLQQFPKIFKFFNRDNRSPRVIVTGCYDWFHSGHIRFFEEASSYGYLYVAVGNDENVRLLKGDGHPMFNQAQRLYMVSAIRYVHKAGLTSGEGWLDAEPEIKKIRPQFYVVNEDGDKPEKREFCEKSRIKYVVLKRTPKEGLPSRSSTELRGF